VLYVYAADYEINIIHFLEIPKTSYILLIINILILVLSAFSDALAMIKMHNFIN